VGPKRSGGFAVEGEALIKNGFEGGVGFEDGLDGFEDVGGDGLVGEGVGEDAGDGVVAVAKFSEGGGDVAAGFDVGDEEEVGEGGQQYGDVGAEIGDDVAREDNVLNAVGLEFGVDCFAGGGGGWADFGEGAGGGGFDGNVGVPVEGNEMRHAIGTETREGVDGGGDAMVWRHLILILNW